MTQIPPLPAAPSDIGDLEQAFPGCVVTHVVSITTDNQLDAAIEALSLLRASGADLQRLHLSRVGDVMDHRLNVTGLRQQQIRVLANRIAALPGVRDAKVEHQIGRTGAVIR
jgi:hypothetical protein